VGRGSSRGGKACWKQPPGRRPDSTGGWSAARVTLETAGRVGRVRGAVPRPDGVGPRARHPDARHPGDPACGHRYPTLVPPSAVSLWRGPPSMRWGIERRAQVGPPTPAAGGLLVLWPPGALGVRVLSPFPRSAGQRTRSAQSQCGATKRAGTCACRPLCTGPLFAPLPPAVTTNASGPPGTAAFVHAMETDYRVDPKAAGTERESSSEEWAAGADHSDCGKGHACHCQ